MKKVISIFLLISLCSQLMMKVAVLVSWKFNQKYIAETLCINRSKPEMECNGKCHLQKQLKQVDTEKSEKETPLASKLNNFKTDDFTGLSGSGITAFVGKSLVVEFHPVNDLYTFNALKTCFHPPQV